MIADFSAHCARKLREQKSYCRSLIVNVSSNRFRKENYYRNEAEIHFDVPTNDVREMAAAASAALKTIFYPRIGYKQAGVTVKDIVNGGVQTNMYDTVDRIKQERLLKTLDGLCKKYGDRTVRVAMQGDCSGEADRKFRSPCYTTNLNDLFKVKIV